jgi:hypothetical protein
MSYFEGTNYQAKKEDQGKSLFGKEDKVVKELTPELSEKLWKGIQQKLHDQRVSKDMVLHHLKQLKAQLGKERVKPVIGEWDNGYRQGISMAIIMIDKKIEKVNKL